MTVEKLERTAMADNKGFLTVGDLREILSTASLDDSWPVYVIALRGKPAHAVVKYLRGGPVARHPTPSLLITAYIEEEDDHG